MDDIKLVVYDLFLTRSVAALNDADDLGTPNASLTIKQQGISLDLFQFPVI